MGEITLDTTERTPVTLKLRNDDGSTTDYHFEVVPMTKPRQDAARPVLRKIRELAEKAQAGEATIEDEGAATSALAEYADIRVRSTNGPVTISSLWDDGLLPREYLQLLVARVNEETPGPPA